MAQQVNPPNLGTIPPDLTQGVDPNILLTFDNSGSMANQYIPDSASDTTKKRFYAVEWNKIYYDPNTTYLPALLPDTTSMDSKTATTYTAALNDGICTNRPTGGPSTCATGLTGTVNLSTKFDTPYGSGARTASGQASGSVDGFYMVNKGGTCALSATNPNPADTCYNIVKMSTQSAAQQKNFAIWFSYYRFRNLMARTGISRSFATLSTNVRVTWQNIGRDSAANTTLLNDGNTATIDMFGGTLRTKFFNWLYANAADINTPNRAALIRGGEFFKQGAGKHDTTNPYWDATLGKELSCRQNYHMLVTDGYWNEQNPSTSSSLNPVSATAIGLDSQSITLPDGKVYNPANNEAKIYGNEKARTNNGCDNSSAASGNAVCKPSIADIAWYYWSTDLRSDLTNNVPPFYPDLTTGVIPGTTVAASIPDPSAVPEIYFNPTNDPASWQHVVQYIIGLGVPGTLQVPPSSPPDETDTGAALGDYANMRKGVLQWPQLINNDPTALDDTWHATINGRGGYFNAGNPQELTTALSNVLNNIAARSSSSSAGAVSTSIIGQATNTAGFVGGFDSGNWSGFLYQETLDPQTGEAKAAVWDAGCILTGGAFTPIAPAPGTQPRGTCKTNPIPTPPARTIFTSIANGSSLKGVPFQWTSLSSAEQGYLNLDPNTTDPNNSTGIVTGSSDGNGIDRVDYLRGKRANESSPTAQSMPRIFRKRNVLLGPVINSQTQYVGGPNSGLADIFPAGSPEQIAAEPCISGGLSSSSCKSYEKFVKTNIGRPPMVYVGANDGMLHAFDATTGNEQWAYVPNILYRNGQLGQTTNTNNTLIPSVDDTPIIQDAFISTPQDSTVKWRTMLVGSMRLGGRGIYALDITDSTKPSSETAAAGKFMWEFSNANDPDLGYTYGSTNMARLRNGKWVVLLTSGYFPYFLPGRSVTFPTGEPDNAPAATANITHLWVLDASNGSVIAKLNTKTGITSFGLSTPNAVDFGLDQITDVSVAGDLAGNLWRFDLSDKDPTKWVVDLMFQTYAAGTTALCSSTTTTGIGCEPISSQVETSGDRLTGGVIHVFGSGKYLDKGDKSSSSVLTTQHFFGVRDYGPRSAKYPLHQSDLVQQKLTQSGSTRTSTNNPVPLTKGGWIIPLDVVTGERDVITATKLDFIGADLIETLISSDNGDPCTPGRTGAVMLVDSSTGSLKLGAVVNNPAIVGIPQVIIVQHPKPPSPTPTVDPPPDLVIPGVGIIGGVGATSFSLDNVLPIQRRTSWRELLNNQ